MIQIKRNAQCDYLSYISKERKAKRKNIVKERKKEGKADNLKEWNKKTSFKTEKGKLFQRWNKEKEGSDKKERKTNTIKKERKKRRKKKEK